MRLPAVNVCACTALLASLVSAQETWRPIATTNAPEPRERAAMAYDVARGTVVLFGGLHTDPITGPLVHGDTWTYDGSDWTRHAVSGPPPRVDHGMGWDPVTASVILAGGRDANGRRVDTWAWNGTTWTRLGDLPTQDRTDVCRRLDYHAEFGVLVYGTSANTFGLGGGTWRRVADHVDLVPTTPIDFAALTAGRVFVAAYATGSGASVFKTLRFDPFNPANGDWQGWATPQAARGGHLYLASDPYRGAAILAIGGQTFEVSTGAPSVQEIPTLQNLDPDLAGATMAFDTARRRAVVFGGRIGANYSRTTYELVPAQRAALEAYGTGCPASPAGSPALGTIPTLGGLPYVGGRFALAATGFAAGVPAFLVLGFDDRTWAGGVLPFPLDALGMPGCSLLVQPNDIVGIGTTSPGGGATSFLDIPAEPSLAGREFFAQGLALQPGANPLGIAWTDALAAVIGER